MAPEKNSAGYLISNDNLYAAYRFNNEQGYGRIQLDNALPLPGWPASASGLLVQDSVGSTTVGGISGLDTTINAQTGWNTEVKIG